MLFRSCSWPLAPTPLPAFFWLSSRNTSLSVDQPCLHFMVTTTRPPPPPYAPYHREACLCDKDGVERWRVEERRGEVGGESRGRSHKGELFGNAPLRGDRGMGGVLMERRMRGDGGGGEMEVFAGRAWECEWWY